MGALQNGDRGFHVRKESSIRNEWDGFVSDASTTARLVRVKIRSQTDQKLFRFGGNVVLPHTGTESSEEIWSRRICVKA
jgi:hypothetical protein